MKTRREPTCTYSKRLKLSFVGLLYFSSQSDSDVAEEAALLNSAEQRRNSHSGSYYSTVALVPPMSTMNVWRGIT